MPRLCTPSLVVLISPILHFRNPPSVDDHTCPFLPLDRYTVFVDAILQACPRDHDVLCCDHHAVLRNVSAPLHIVVGNLELGATRLCNTARDIGAQLTVLPLFHDAIFFYADIPEAHDAMDRIVRSIQNALASERDDT